jgi:hypothetical protein
MNKVLAVALWLAAWPGSAVAQLVAPAATGENGARRLQAWQDQIALPIAAQLGQADGRGVLVGIADTGAELSHAELRGQIAATYNAFDGSNDVTDALGHGTRVAGLIVGTRAGGSPYDGVASGARLAVAKIFSASGATSGERIDQGLEWLVAGAHAQIISLSIGGASATNPAVLRIGVAKGVLFAIAAGNEGRASVDWPARYASAAWANNQIIVVGAVDAANRLAPFSNHGADTAAWFVVAPGVDIVSSALGNGAAGMSGTSIATPIVAGQAALIKSAWPFLAAGQVSQIIFQSATRLGAGTDSKPDPVYGWGLINVARSMGPIGALIGAAGNRTVSLGSATMLGAIGNVSTHSLAMVGVDLFGRGFDVDLARNVQSTTAALSTSGELFAELDRHDALVEQVNGPQTAAAAPDGRLAVARRLPGGVWVGAGSGSTSDRFFGLSASGMTPFAASPGDKFNAPYFAMVQGATHGGVSLPIGADARLRVGVLTQGAAMPDVAWQTLSPVGRRQLLSTEYERRSARAVGIVSIGVMRESGSLLGSVQGDALALNATPRTAFIALSGGYTVTPRLTLVGMAAAGHTGGFNNVDSLVSQVSTVGTVAYSLGLSARALWDGSDRLGLTVSMPTKVTTGSISLSGAVAQREDGTLSYGTRMLDLRPSACERDFELSYTRALGGGKLSGALMLRLHPGHDAGTPNDALLGVRYARRF